MATFETFYDINPVSIIDQNQWDDRIPEVALQFRQAPVLYTPMIDWDDTTQRTGAATTIFTELLEGDVDVSEIPLTANYIDSPHTPDSRQRTLTTTRYGDKVQLHESTNIFQQWKMSGGRDWRPLLRGLLGRNVVNKFELLARNSFLLQPSAFWTYADGGGSPASIGDIAATDTFNFGIVNEWNLRLGNTGTPVVPGDSAGIKMAIIPPGVTYDFQESLAAASANEQSMWRDTQIYSGQALRYEIGAYKGTRFMEHPNDRYGMNNAVLYNFGAIDKQYGVTQAINSGDGAPDPETTTVDGVWNVGQKGVVHYIQLEDFASGDFEVDDIVTIHVVRTDTYGVTNGVDPTAGKVIYRRIVAEDDTTNRLSFDRPIMFRYDTPFNAASETGASETILYAFVTKGRHIAMNLVLGSRGGIMGEVARPLKFYEPRPIDDFESVWRYVWDIVAGYNIWDPHLYELHFSAVSLPKRGGVITP
jgi:hypothetical protein